MADSRFCLFLSLALVTPALATAQDGRRASGPAVGSEMAALRVFEVGHGECDLREVVGKKPAAILFVQVIDRNVAPILRGLDAIDRERALTGLVVKQVFVHGDRSLAERRMTAVNGSLRLKSPLVLSLDGAEGPGAYALDKNCSLTLVLFKDGKVQRSVGFVDPGRQDIQTLRSWVAEIDGPLPKTLEEWEARLARTLPADVTKLRRRLIASELAREQMRQRLRKLQADLRRANNQLRRRGNARANPRRRNPGRDAARGADAMRRDGAMRDAPRAGQGRDAKPSSRPAPRKREGSAPTDAQLMTLLRSFLRKTNEPAECDRIYEQILFRSAVDDDLAKQTREMFRLMLSLEYGAPRARHLATSYVQNKRPESRKKR